MSKEIKPIKRSEQLAPLSRDHHEALLFVWKIRQGMKNGTDQKIIGQFVDWFWKGHLQEHFREEEQILAPWLPKENLLVQRMLDDHQEIEALVHINEQIADPNLLEELAGKINDHVRFEERELFPFAEQQIPLNRLDAIKEQLMAEVHTGSPWTNEFWLKK
jgi:hemerythrin-like domain-containing protein